MWTFRTMIVPLAHSPLAADLAKGIAGPPGDGMWTTGLSATGELPATHYISTGYIEEEFAKLLPLTANDEAGKPTTRPGKPTEIVAAAKEANVSATLTKVNAMLNASNVTEEDPFVAMERMGLKLINVAP